jgi:hypothetical protein
MAGHLLCSWFSTLMHNLPLPWNTGFIALLALMHTITDGGVSVTEQTAVAVIPQRPASPSVVMTLTAPTGWPWHRENADVVHLIAL